METDERNSFLTGWNLTEGPEGAIKLDTVHIDDCCKLRAKITSVFGDTISIKLDLFHAVQWITNTLCKRHLLVQRCMQDLQLVFQQDSDSRVTRMAATPSPEVILSRMNKFVARNQRPRDENIATWPRKRSTCLLTDHRGFLTIVLTPESETMYFEDH